MFFKNAKQLSSKEGSCFFCDRVKIEVGSAEAKSIEACGEV